MSNQLKPCPFCGGDQIKFRLTSLGETWLFCESCYMSFESAGEASELSLTLHWNRRPVENDLRTRLRTTAQTLIAEVGADGPTNVEDAAARAIAAIRDLRVRLAATERCEEDAIYIDDLGPLCPACGEEMSNENEKER